MPNSTEKINQLQARLDKMVEYQDYFFREINLIRDEISKLKVNQKIQNTLSPPESLKKPPAREDISFYKPHQHKQPVQETVPANSTASQTTAEPVSQIQSDENRQTSKPNFTDFAPKFQFDKSELEKFIGENLISKIGILILVLGVAIGAKYAIDNDLISPLTRIVLGYACAVGLLGFAIRLKKKYLNFSAVLLSGSLAIMYFVTFAAYNYYSLIPQILAFLLMLFFTAFTVVAAINYNRQVIAHIGLVGAYAIPFLLSEGSGRANILFGYVAIINVGILIISIKKYWKPLFYTAFIFTWASYYAWYLTNYKAAEHFTLALFFLAVFFLTFYLTFLAYKLISREQFTAENIILLLANSFIFYGLGYSIIETREGGEQFLGLFTVVNATVHFVVGFVINKYKLADRNAFYLALGLVLVFITIAVPVQLDGNWVTLLWTAEAALLFWIGRAKGVSLYEYSSYPLMVLAFVSLLNDWQVLYENYFLYNTETAPIPVFNIGFLTALLFAAAYAFIYFVNRDERYAPPVKESFQKAMAYGIPAVLLVVLYNAFRTEIGNYFQYRIVGSAVRTSADNFPTTDKDLDFFNLIWQLNYTMLFLTILSFINVKKIKSFILGLVNLGLNSLVMFIFLSLGLYVLSELRNSYLQPTNADVFDRGIFHIVIRYVSYVSVAGLIISSYQYVKQKFFNEKFSDGVLTFAFNFALHFSVLWIASSELVNWMDIFGYRNSYKLGLSILWGIYALFLIALGINKHKKHLRIGAIALFALTLAKLFFYDISDLDTISKTVVFVALGILLLIISFLYNKYKHLIFETSES